jgi:hypothetical protein
MAANTNGYSQEGIREKTRWIIVLLRNYIATKLSYHSNKHKTQSLHQRLRFRVGKVFCIKTLNHIASVCSAQIKQPHEQTQNTIFTLKITFSGKQCRAKTRCNIRTNSKRNLYIKDCIFKSVLWNLIQGASKHKMQSKKLWFTKTLGKLSNQTQNAIFTLKIAFSSRVNHASVRHQTASLPFHMNSVDPKKKSPPNLLISL